ncbi:MAG: sugar ABC transporter [Comamonas sp.]|uniref:sugar ABC transporter n=1 Tax=Comamonas sp. TaxID=34028 RepID=UPI00281D8C93|nr:sugar ABC transporter [Comamonas sp.]MDR0215410.1 sugar ABC transporter [Comamonas sp.]
MIYTVECSYADARTEAEWNDFYSLHKLPALISVSGFHTSQRFKALSTGYPVYLALHTIDGLDVLTGEEYREKGGGNFARWQSHITDWHRNLYACAVAAPAVQEGELLLVSNQGPEAFLQLGLVLQAMEAVALERCPARRWLAKLPAEKRKAMAVLPQELDIYEAMTPQLRKVA